MERAEFSRRILSIGGTYADVNRLDEAGRESAADAHDFLREEMGEADFTSFCYEIGRDFVWDNMGELFFLEHPENANDQRRINRWAYLIRNVSNIGMCLSAFCNENADGITWADIGEMEKVLSDLREICEFANIEVKEV